MIPTARRLLRTAPTLALLAAACGPQVPASRPLGYAVPARQAWPSATIPVCWENPTPATQAWREQKRQHIEAAYAPVTMLRFVGWETCRGAEAGLHIEIYGDGPLPYRRGSGGLPPASDGHPRVFGFGRALDGARPGLLLNPWLRDVLPGLRDQAASVAATGPGALENLQDAIAVHEMGHALGLMHEQARPDSRCEDYPDSRAGGGVPQGAYDPESIMNYCVTRRSDFVTPLALSVGDVAALRAMFGGGR